MRLAISLAAGACGSLIAWGTSPVPSPAPGARPAAARAAARGEYLVNAMGCHDCHTPKKIGPQGPVRDESRLLAGQPQEDTVTVPARVAPPWTFATNAHMGAWSGPWGISYAINLTPDEDTGLGSWSEETFVKAMRTAKHMGVSRPILPPMPWYSLNALTDADLRAVYAYLRTIPAVKNRVPEPVPPASPPAAR